MSSKKVFSAFFLSFCFFVICVSPFCLADSQGPSAGLSIQPETAEINEPIVFDASGSLPGTGVNLSYTLDYGDGTIDFSNSTNVFFHSYSSYGTFTVTLTVSTDLGVSSLSDTVNIFPSNPIASLSGRYDSSVEQNGFSKQAVAGVTEVFFDASQSFDTDLSTSNLMYRFSFGDGGISQWQNSCLCSHVYETVGKYVAYVTVKNQTGALSSDSNGFSVTVISSLRAQIISNQERSRDVPVTISFDVSNCVELDNDNYIAKYLVDFGDGSSVVVNNSYSSVTHEYTKEGEFHATVTITNDVGEISSDTVTIKLGSAFLLEIIGYGALIFTIIAIIIVLLSTADELSYDPLGVLFFVGIGGIIGAVIGSILGALWYYFEWWTILIIIGFGVLIFILMVFLDGGGSGSLGSGGWYGDSLGHSIAAKKGWRNR